MAVKFERRDSHLNPLEQTPASAEGSIETGDLELLRRAATGSGPAFHQLVDRHAQRLYRLAVSLVGNASDAEDVLQEAFAGAFRGLSGFEARSSVKTWLTRILVTQAAKWRRDKARRPMGSLTGDHADAGGDPASSVQASVDLHAALRQLSPEHREVLVLREFEGLSYEEIAKLLDVPRGTIESRLHRARAELRDKLKGYA
jgi:RNA polymerase sigma-70 factor (ECF subfamily)